MTVPEPQTQEPEMRGPIRLDSVDDERFAIVEPFEVSWYEEMGHVITWIEEIEEWGCGLTLDESLRDLQRSVVEAYDDLHRERHNLGAGMDRIYDVLRRKMRINAVLGA